MLGIVAHGTDIKQIPLGTIVTLVLVRDREMVEYKLVIAERGVVSRRTEVALNGDQAREVAKFLNGSLRPVVTDDPRAEPDIDDDPTKPER